MKGENILFPSVSVVMPTLNCRYLIESHAEEIRALCSQVGEIVVVDSFSEDGTVEFLERTLEGLPYRVHLRPRGLYAAWNAGIGDCSGEWIHIATAGDLLGCEELGYLVEVARETGADVISGIPRFVDTAGELMDDQSWPIVELFQRRAGESVVKMSGSELVAFSLAHCRLDRRAQSWLGSSASNLYRSAILKKFPFPTDVGPSGDVLWALENADKVSAAFCGRRSGRFVVHGKEASGPGLRDEKIASIYTRAWSDARDWLIAEVAGEMPGIEVKRLFEEMLEDQLKFAAAVVRLRKRRKEIAELKARLQDARNRVPRHLRRFVFKKVEAEDGELESC